MHRYQAIPHNGEAHLSNEEETSTTITSSTSQHDAAAPLLYHSFMGGNNSFFQRRQTDGGHNMANHRNYTDLAAEVQSTRDGYYARSRSGVAVPFVITLHVLLETVERDGHADIISWQPHGRCFLVHKPKLFAQQIMPTYFKMSKFPSFLRQLTLYAFRRLTRAGPDKGGYYHENFLRNKAFLAYRIPRTKIKGNRVRAPSYPDTQPDFYLMPSVEESNAIAAADKASTKIQHGPGKMMPLRTTSSIASGFSKEYASLLRAKINMPSVEESSATAAANKCSTMIEHEPEEMMRLRAKSSIASVSSKEYALLPRAMISMPSVEESSAAAANKGSTMIQHGTAEEIMWLRAKSSITSDLSKEYAAFPETNTNATGGSLELEQRQALSFAGQNYYTTVLGDDKISKQPDLDTDQFCNRNGMGGFFLGTLNITSPDEYDDIVKNLGNDRDYGSMIARRTSGKEQQPAKGGSGFC